MYCQTQSVKWKGLYVPAGGNAEWWDFESAPFQQENCLLREMLPRVNYPNEQTDGVVSYFGFQCLCLTKLEWLFSLPWWISLSHKAWFSCNCTLALSVIRLIRFMLFVLIVFYFIEKGKAQHKGKRGNWGSWQKKNRREGN